MTFYPAIELIGETIISELLNGIEKGSLISGVFPLCAVFILAHIWTALLRARKQAFVECNRIRSSQRRY